MRYVIPLILALLVLPVFGLILSAPAVHASVSVVQNTSAHFSSISDSEAFTTSVTSGDLVVVGILTFAPASTVSTVTDSLGLSYTKAVQLPDSHANDVAAIYYATLSKGGSDTVMMTLGLAPVDGWDVYLFEVSGVTPPVVTTGQGASGATPSSSIATASTSFTSPAFLIAVVGFFNCLDEAINPGPGFSYITAPNPTTTCSALEIADPVASPTTFPATITSSGSSGSDNWVEVGAAFSASTLIPEYPLGLPVLAILTVIGYAVIRRFNATKKPD